MSLAEARKSCTSAWVHGLKGREGKGGAKLAKMVCCTPYGVHGLKGKRREEKQNCNQKERMSITAVYIPRIFLIYKIKRQTLLYAAKLEHKIKRRINN